MKNKILSLSFLVILVVLLSSCARTAENEHLPNYCQTYSGFMATTSPDMYELLSEEIGEVNQFNYLSVISEIELSFEVDEPNREIDLGGIQCFQNLTSLTLVGSSFKDISEISALKNIQSITLEDTSIVNINSFKNLSKVKELTISGSKQLQSVDGVEEMTKLTHLELTNNGIVNIKELDSLVNLQSLILNNNEISDFPEITQLNKLVDLDVSYNNIQSFGENLNGLSNLKTFTASYNNICDISNLDDLVSIESLYLDNNNLGCLGESPDFSSLTNAPNLKVLYLNDNNLTSISDLADKDLPLEKLYLHNNLLTDITPISLYTTLTDLRLENNLISNIDDLSGMINLTNIDLKDNNLTDFEDLLTINGLEIVHLERNQIESIPDLEFHWPHLTELYLSENNLRVGGISGIEGHENIQVLDVRLNGLEIIEGLSDLPSLKEFILYDEEVEDDPFDPDPVVEPSEYPENIVRVIIDSYNNVGLSLVDDEEGDGNRFNLGFELSDNGEIYGSFNNVPFLSVVDLTDMGLSYIDDESFSSLAIVAFYLDGNSVTDIGFILNNPNLGLLELTGNPVENLTILSGDTTTDLQNLTVILADGINYPNNLDGAFVNLPALTTLDLTDTEFNSISNSFNDLNSISSLSINTSTVSKIVNSFNRLNPTSGAYVFTFDGGALGEISGSFNDSSITGITISDHSPVLNDTYISDSFNNLTLSSEQGLLIYNGDFKEITNSFNNSDFSLLGLTNLNTNTITDSFDQLTLESTLSLHGNNLETLDLSGLLYVEELILANNQLTTVSFIHDIPGLEVLDISNQLHTDGSTLTLTTIDGINDQPDLRVLLLTNVPISSIDGLRNTSLTSFLRNKEDNTSAEVAITSISPTSFSGSPITSLELKGHFLTDYQFLSNLDSLIDLEISLNTADLAAFGVLSSNQTLETLYFENAALITDFSIFNTYNTLTELTVNSPDVVINNFNPYNTGPGVLDSLILGNFTSITDINNSFNEGTFLAIGYDFLDYALSLQNINDSFNLSVYPQNAMQIHGDLNITNSFNDTPTVQIINGLETTPKFDTASFTNTTQIIFGNTNYDSFDFLNTYTSIQTISIAASAKDIVGLDNEFIQNVTIGATNVNNINISIAESGTIELEGDIDVDVTTNASYIVFSSAEGTVDLFPTNDKIYIAGYIGNLTVDSIDTTEIIVMNGYYETVVLDMPNLATYRRDLVNTSQNTDSLTINSNVSSVNYSFGANTTTINNDILNSGNVLSKEDGDIIINSQVSTLGITTEANDLTINNNLLETLTFTSTSSTNGALYLYTNSLNELNATINTASEIEVNTLVSTLDLNTVANNIVTVNGTNLTSLDVSSNNADIIVNSDQTALQGEFIGSNLIVNNSNLLSMTTHDTTQLTNDLDLDNAGVINSLTLGLADISNVRFTTTNATITVDGVNIGTYYIDGSNANSVDINSPSSVVNLTTNQTTLDIDAQLVRLDVLNDSLTTITIDANTSISVLDLLGTSNVSNVTNNGTISNLEIITNASSLDIIGYVDIISIESDTITSLTLNTNHVSFTSNITNTLTFDLVADSAILNLEASNVIIDNTTNINQLTISSSNMSSFSFGTATISEVYITETALTAVTVDGNANMTLVNVSSSFTSLTANLDVATDLIVASQLSLLNGAPPIQINANTSKMQVITNYDATINNANLNDLTLNAVNHHVIVNNEGVTTLSVTGSASILDINDSVLDAISFSQSNIDTLRLYDVAIDSLTVTNTRSFILDTANVTTLNLTAPDLLSLNFTTPNLSSLNNVHESSATIDTDSTSLSLSGDYNMLTVTADSATTVNMNGSTIRGTYSLNAASLASIDVAGAYLNTGSLVFNTNQTNISVTNTEASLDINSPINAVLTVTSNTDQSFSVSFEGEEVNLITPNTDIMIIGSVIERLNGDARDIDISVDLTVTLTIDSSANSITVNGNNVEVINLQSGNTVSYFNVLAHKAIEIYTNDSTITNFQYDANNPDQVLIDSKATNILFNNPATNASLYIVAYNNTNQIVSNSIDTTFTSTEFATVDYVNDNDGIVGIQFNNLNRLNITLTDAPNANLNGSAITLDVTMEQGDYMTLNGDVNTVLVRGNNVAFIDTTFFTAESVSILDTAIINAVFISPTLANTMTDLEINTFTVESIPNIFNELNGYTFDLISTLSLQDFYDHYYNEHLATLQDSESNTQNEFNILYDAYVDTAVDYLKATPYFSYINTSILDDNVRNSSFDTTENYVIDYVNYLEGTNYQTITDILENLEYTQQDIDLFTADVNLILSNNILVIDEVVINQQVQGILMTRAADFAQSIEDSITFTFTTVQ